MGEGTGRLGRLESGKVFFGFVYTLFILCLYNTIMRRVGIGLRCFSTKSVHFHRAVF